MAREEDQVMAVAAERQKAAERQELCIATREEGAAVELDALQGLWTEAQYLRMTEHTSRPIEFTDGHVEVLPMPTDRHQVVLRFLLFALDPFIRQRGGTVLFSGLRLRIRKDKFREPDLLLLRDATDARRRNDYWRGADWVAEVVSPDRPARDTVTKRRDYAEARIPEYWIASPIDETVTVLVLEGDAYTEHGVFRRGERATSVCLEGFSVSVEEVFDAT